MRESLIYDIGLEILMIRKNKNVCITPSVVLYKEVTHIYMPHTSKIHKEGKSKYLRSDKENIVKICKDIQEGNHAMKDVIQFHSNGEQININSLPWMLKPSSKVMLQKKSHGKLNFPLDFVQT